MMDLSIVIVNYNTRDYTAQCIDSIFQNPARCSYEIVLVDNASSDGSAAWLAEHYPMVKLVRSPKNAGIAGGNNLGIRESGGRYVLLLNNDTLVLPGVLDRAVCLLGQYPEAGGIGGQLLNPNGSFQSSYLDFASLWQVFLITTRLGYLGRSYYPSHGPSKEIQEVDWMSTAFTLFRREALEQVGLVDEEFFIYSDEPDLEYRLEQAGWKILYSPDIKTIHFGGKSLTPWRRRRLVYRGYLLFFTKHRTRLETLLLRIMFAVASLIKLPFWAMLCLVPTRRVRAKEELESHRDIFQMSISSGVIPPDGNSSKRKGSLRINELSNIPSTKQRLDAALRWLLQAWAATGHCGMSAGYDLLRRKWKPAYPETTGYAIPTLFDCAQVTGDDTYRQVAIALAEYELSVQTTEGAILCPTGEPIAFDTGQVIFGWMRAWREVGDVRYLRAAQRVADWLAQNQSPDGAWREHQYLNVVKVIDTRVAWSLLEVDQASGPSCYRESARRNLDWAVAQQRANGWFDHCALRAGALPITHTLAYTIEGLLESGILLGEDRYILAARKTADVLLGLQRADGFLGGQFDSQWKPSTWSCLTGNVQMALVWFRLYDITHDANYLRGARAAIDFVRQRQNLKSKNPGVRGGIPGSSPIWGPYERFKYPNWAVKFFIDALLAEEKYRTRIRAENHVA